MTNYGTLLLLYCSQTNTHTLTKSITWMWDPCCIYQAHDSVLMVMITLFWQTLNTRFLCILFIDLWPHTTNSFVIFTFHCSYSFVLLFSFLNFVFIISSVMHASLYQKYNGYIVWMEIYRFGYSFFLFSLILDKCKIVVVNIVIYL